MSAVWFTLATGWSIFKGVFWQPELVDDFVYETVSVTRLLAAVFYRRIESPPKNAEHHIIQGDHSLYSIPLCLHKFENHDIFCDVFGGTCQVVCAMLALCAIMLPFAIYVGMETL